MHTHSHAHRQTHTPLAFPEHWVFQASLLLKFYQVPGREASLPGFKVCFCPFLALYPWSSHLTSLCLSFLIYKMDIIICRIHRVAGRIQWITACMALRPVSGAQWLSVNVSDYCCCELGKSVLWSSSHVLIKTSLLLNPGVLGCVPSGILELSPLILKIAAWGGPYYFVPEGNWGLERFSNLPKVTYLVNG